MKKILYLIILASPVFFSHCKKDKDLTHLPPSAEQVVFDPLKHAEALKGISVDGSEKILFDSLKRAFIIQMPQSYTSDQIHIALKLEDGIELLDSVQAVTVKTDLNFLYKGSLPLQLAMRPKGKPESPYYYAIYVSFPGPPDVELLNSIIPASIGQVQLPIKINSGVGTIPSNPRNEKRSSVKLLNPKTGKSYEGGIQNNLHNAYFSDAGELVNLSNLSLELEIEEQKFTFGGIHYKRSSPTAFVYIINNLYSKKDTIPIQGGYFLPDKKYLAQFSNDQISTPFAFAAKYLTPTNISSKLSNTLPDGSYLVTFLEGDSIIGKSAVYVSDGTENGIETVWQGNKETAFAINTEKLLFKAGASFYAKPLKPQFAHGSNAPASAFDLKLLPNLQLRNGSSVTVLKPELDVVSWGLAGVSFSIGKYKIPADMRSGSYEVLPIFSNNKASKPYWSKIQIQ